MQKLLQFLLLLSVASFSACKPNSLETDIDPQDSKMVINSIISPDSALWISVSNSNIHFPGTGGSEAEMLAFIEKVAVNDALVILSVDQYSDTLEPMGYGMYALKHIRQYPGKLYKLQVSRKSDGQQVAAFAIMPGRSSIKSAKVSLPNPFNGNKVKLRAEVNDPQQESNFYLATFSSVNYTGIPSSGDGGLRMVLSLLKKDLLHFESFNDKKQDKGCISIAYDFPRDAEQDTLTIMVSGIEEGYYNFLQQQKNAGNFISRLSGEVVHYQTNIVGGYGYFSLRLPDIRRIPPSEFGK